MTRKLWLFVILLGCPSLWAQLSTTVSSTGVVDPSGQTWANGTYQISFVSEPQYGPSQYVWPGGPFALTYTGSLSSGGAFSISLPSNPTMNPTKSKWLVSVCPLAASSCYGLAITATGSTMDITTALNAQLRNPSFAGTPTQWGYNDAEVLPPPSPGTMYYNVVDGKFHCWTASLTWNDSCNGGGSGGGGSSITLENTYNAPGSFTFAHNLASLFPQVTCYTRTGGSYGPATYSVTPIDVNDTSITVPSAGDYICAFSSVTAPVPGFSIAVAPTTQLYEPTMTGTQSPTYAVSQTASGSYSGTVTYSTSGLASGMTGVYSPTTITGAGSNTLTVNFPAAQAAATTSFNVNGTDGTTSHSANPSITVGNINQGLLDCWPMTDGSGTTFADGCATSNTATLAAGSLTWQANFSLPGLTALMSPTAYLTGANQTTTNITGATAFSVTSWVGSTSWGGGSRAVISSLDTANNFVGWELEIDAAGAPHAFLINTYPSNAIETACNTGMSAGEHYVAWTYDGSKTATGNKFYIDGVLCTNTVTLNVLTGSIVNTKNVAIGARTNGTDALDAVESSTRLYNRVLSQTDINNYLAAGAR